MQIETSSNCTQSVTHHSAGEDSNLRHHYACSTEETFIMKGLTCCIQVVTYKVSTTHYEDM